MKQIIFSLMLGASIFLTSTINNCLAHTNLNNSNFEIPASKKVDYKMKDYTMTLSPELSREMIRKSGLHPTFGQRVSVWFENTLIWLSSISDRISLIYAKLTNNIEMKLRAEEAIQECKKAMYYNRAAIGLKD